MSWDSCEFGTGQEVFGAGRIDVGVGHVQHADGFAQEGRFPRLRLDHAQCRAGDGDLQRQRRRSAAGTDVEHVWMGGGQGMRMSVAVVRAEHMFRGNQRFDQEAIDGLVWRVGQRKRREIDLLIPEFEEVVVGHQRIDELRVKAETRFAGPFQEPIAQFPNHHG